MPSLHELQASFALGLITPGNDDVLAHLIPAQRMNARGGLTVYRNNVFQNYRNALRDTYPVIERLVGAEFFLQAVDAYIRTTPSTSGDVHDYGENFDAFLRDYPGASALVYLPDVAALEWAVHRAYHAAASDSLDISQLADIAEDAHSDLRFTLHPACRLIASPWPVLTIWRVNQPDYASEQTVDLALGGECALVMRRGEKVEPASLSVAEHVALAAFQAGASLEGALEAALAQDAAFDLGAFLQYHVLTGTFTSFIAE